MSNNCTNYIQLTGRSEVVQKFLDECCVYNSKLDSHILSFEKILPPPENINEMELYDWFYDNWGTGGLKHQESFSAVTADNTTQLSFIMDTASNPPIAIIQTIAKKYPSLTGKMESIEIGLIFGCDLSINGDGTCEVIWYEDDECEIRFSDFFEYLYRGRDMNLKPCYRTERYTPEIDKLAIEWLLEQKNTAFEDWGFVWTSNAISYQITIINPIYCKNFRPTAVVHTNPSNETGGESQDVCSYDLFKSVKTINNTLTEDGRTVKFKSDTRNPCFTDRGWQRFSIKKKSNELLAITFHYTSEDDPDSIAHEQEWIIAI